MRRDEAFVLGAMIGAVAVWLWGRTIEDRIAEKTRAFRTKAADGIQAVEETIRPA
jgi:membrane protein DedA with SNARE-associated domain